MHLLSYRVNQHTCVVLYQIWLSIYSPLTLRVTNGEHITTEADGEEIHWGNYMLASRAVVFHQVFSTPQECGQKGRPT